MQMIPTLYDGTTYLPTAVLDGYRSLIWTGRYYGPGDFQLITAPDPRIRIGDLLTYAGEWMIIEKISTGRDADGLETQITTGRSLLSLIGRRIVAEQTQINNKTMTTALSTLLTDAIIAPTIAAREISNFTHDTTETIPDRVTIQITGDNLLDAAQKLCERTGTGQRVDLVSGSYVYKLYQGTDKSATAIFSDRYDNLGEASYIVNDTTKVTDALVAGEGEGTARTAVWATEDAPSGIDRREAYVDARDMSSDGGTIPSADYEESLRQRGLEALTEYTAALSADVYLPAGAYRSTISLGDLATIEHTGWGLRLKARLVEVIETVDEAGAYTLRPTFGL